MENESRRKFIGNMTKMGLAGTVVPTTKAFSKKSEIKNMFIHHVYFWLKNQGSMADKDKLIEGLRKLSKVKTIQQFNIGTPADTNRDVIERGYALSWFALFKNPKDQASYQVDPIHLKFVEDYAHLWEKVIVYDSIDA
ncbi:MAG: Dabb family protein [Saprospiraceae bacterium]